MISQSKSVCSPNSLHHCSEGRMSHRHISARAAWIHAETPTCCFFSHSDVTTKDFLNTRPIHRDFLMTRDRAPNKQSPWQRQPLAMRVPLLVVCFFVKDTLGHVYRPQSCMLWSVAPGAHNSRLLVSYRNYKHTLSLLWTAHVASKHHGSLVSHTLSIFKRYQRKLKSTWKLLLLHV